MKDERCCSSQAKFCAASEFSGEQDSWSGWVAMVLYAHVDIYDIYLSTLPFWVVIVLTRHMGKKNKYRYSYFL